MRLEGRVAHGPPPLPAVYALVTAGLVDEQAVDEVAEQVLTGRSDACCLPVTRAASPSRLTTDRKTICPATIDRLSAAAGRLIRTSRSQMARRWMSETVGPAVVLHHRHDVVGHGRGLQPTWTMPRRARAGTVLSRNAVQAASTAWSCSA